MRRLSAVVIWALIFAGLGLTLMYLKITRLAVPLVPSALATVWDVEARVGFEGRGSAAKIRLALPQSPRGFSFIGEDFVSRGYGLAVGKGDGDLRRAVWTIRHANGGQALYYRLKAYPGRVEGTGQVRIRQPPAPEVPQFTEPLASAVGAVLSHVREQSADAMTFTTLLFAMLNTADDENVKVIRESVTTEAWPDLVIRLLAAEHIPSRVVYGLSLGGDFADRELTPWLEVHTGERWQGFNPDTGEEGYPANFLPWIYGHRDVVEATGVDRIRVTFAAARSPMTRLGIARKVENALDTGLLSLSLTDLPVRTQNVYRVLLMVPLGAFVIVLLRMVVGIPTFGTFMPVLVALAFRETRLMVGIPLFLLVVSTGLGIRSALTHLRLLLVPRLASVLVIVIGVMLAISLLSAALGIEQGLSIALFPMVILTMTIERMSIVWEERGPGASVREFMGSLGVAIAAYFVMTEEHLMYLMFVFPELLLVVLALCLLFGAYTGYRLSEILRFRDLTRP